MTVVSLFLLWVIYIHLHSTINDAVNSEVKYACLSFWVTCLCRRELAFLQLLPPLHSNPLCSCLFLCLALKPKSFQVFFPGYVLSTASLHDFHSPMPRNSHLSPDCFMCISDLYLEVVHRHLEFSKSLTEFIICNHLPAQKTQSPTVPSRPRTILLSSFSYTLSQATSAANSTFLITLETISLSLP